jgi:hypothetical protein
VTTDEVLAAAKKNANAFHRGPVMDLVLSSGVTYKCFVIGCRQVDTKHLIFVVSVRGAAPRKYYPKDIKSLTVAT